MMTKLLSVILLINISTCLLGCKEATYRIYCLPLDAEFYVPPDREQIFKYGKMVEITSPMISSLFLLQNKQSSKATSECKGRLRVLIMRISDKVELFVTAERKIIISDSVYVVDEGIVNDLLTQIGCR